MIDNAIYIKILMKKWAAGTLSEEEKVDLEAAKKGYSEEGWFRMEIDACCEVEDEQPDDTPKPDWEPVWERARERELIEQRKALLRNLVAGLGGLFVVLCLSWIGESLLSRP